MPSEKIGIQPGDPCHYCGRTYTKGKGLFQLVPERCDIGSVWYYACQPCYWARRVPPVSLQAERYK